MMDIYHKMSSSSNYGDLIRRLASIRNGYADAREDIMNHFPRYDIDRDVRVIPPNDDKLALVDNFAVFLKIAFIQTFVSSAIESSIRSMTLGVNSDEYRKAEHSFKKVCRLLLSEASLSSFSNQYGALLDLLRCIRNANHDNGIYYGRNEDIEYRGSHYSFTNEAKITFLTWDLLLDFSSDLRDLIQDLVSSDKISSAEKIVDLSVL